MKRKRRNAINNDFVTGETSDDEDNELLPQLPKIYKKTQKWNLIKIFGIQYLFGRFTISSIDGSNDTISINK